MNPVGNAIQKAGLLVTEYPAINGCDVADIVEEVGSDLASKFISGDRVIAPTNPVAGYKFSALHEFVVAELPMPVKIPDNVEVSDAVVLPLCIMTAASYLFEPELLGLNMPPSEAGNGKTLLVWEKAAVLDAVVYSLLSLLDMKFLLLRAARITICCRPSGPFSHLITVMPTLFRQ